MAKPNLYIDLDGTLADPLGVAESWEIGPPLPGARKAVLLLREHFRVQIFTTRGDNEFVRGWLAQNGFPPMNVTNKKGPGIILDDRAVCFTGEWTDHLLSTLKSFAPWWKSTGDVPTPTPQD